MAFVPSSTIPQRLQSFPNSSSFPSASSTPTITDFGTFEIPKLSALPPTFSCSSPTFSASRLPNNLDFMNAGSSLCTSGFTMSSSSSSGLPMSSSSLALSASEDSYILPVYDPKRLPSKRNFLSRLLFHWKYIGGDIEEGDVQRYALGFLSVTIRMPITPWIVLALFFSYVPFIIFIFFFFWCVLTEAFLPFYGMCVVLSSGILCEAFLKNMCKENRPATSAVNSYGMPSCHCMICYGLLSWLIVEAFLYSSITGHKSCIPLCLTLVVLLLPVPWARVCLEDHTAKQCFVGCILGIIWGGVAFIFRYYIFFPERLVF